MTVRHSRRQLLRAELIKMDIRKIKKMIELLEESGIAEIEIKEGEESLRIARALPSQTATYVTAPMVAPAVSPAMPAVPVAASVAAVDAAALRAAAGEHMVTAPMVG